MPNAKMSDQDMLQDVLTTEKTIMSDYNLSITESSCPKMRSMLSSIYNQSVQDQYQTFDNMRTRGWYPTKDAPDADVAQAKQTMGQLKAQLG